LENRVLDFDSAAAAEAASLAAICQKAGRPVDVRDTMIAGIALARRAMLATRNARFIFSSWAAAVQRKLPLGLCARNRTPGLKETFADAQRSELFPRTIFDSFKSFAVYISQIRNMLAI
jgi:hypothetical protein